MRGLGATAAEVLQHRLLPSSPRPITVALSGGGDSVALTLVADAWARAAGRDLAILTVDHRLQPDSAAWTTACAATAERLDRPFRALAWTGKKPTTGLPAAARAARHRLLADAAREAGARVILMGHTADDLLEAQAMREAGATTPDPQTWAPSPVWPEGRGLFVLRPMLGLRRAAIRDWLKARGETWIEDPANADLRYARSRARLAVSGEPLETIDPTPLELAEQATHEVGMITLARAAVRAATPDEAHRVIALAAVCAGGGVRLPQTARIARAADQLRGTAPVVTTLAGARLEADDDQVRIFREAGEFGRSGLAAMSAAPGETVIWDGRFALTADDAAEVRRLAGLARRLPADQRRALSKLPAAARGGLPVLVTPDGMVSSPALTGAARSLIPDRFRAAAGLVVREPA